MPRVPEPAVAVSYTLGFAASRLRRFYCVISNFGIGAKANDVKR